MGGIAALTRRCGRRHLGLSPHRRFRNEIIRQIVAGMDAGAKTPPAVIENRPKAIEWAMEHAEPGERHRPACRGHETYQEIGHEKRHLDETRSCCIVFGENAMKELTLKQIADGCGGKVSARFEHLRVSRMQSDSRKLRSGDLFVALKGAKADGHDFARDGHQPLARSSPRRLSRPISEKLPSTSRSQDYSLPRLRRDRAAGYRKLTGVKVVGITGSVGKMHQGNDRQHPRGGLPHRKSRRATTTITSSPAIMDHGHAGD